ncbi:hypothetical protein B0H16DRAFT_1518183 [Mycena metata]|uniref:Uncharacterized protein n=1 Tax=Mycena metata TaxID=1033252 RepID=A0AAD7NNV1_9AGAR|nr:hypothetical protein B0H16DRAFT_1518183 [Mycena metata]
MMDSAGSEWLFHLLFHPPFARYLRAARSSFTQRLQVRVPALPSLPPPSFSPSPSSLPFPTRSLLPASPLTSLPLRFTPSPPLVLLPVLLVANAGGIYSTSLPRARANFFFLISAAFLCAHTLILVY